MTQEHRPLDGVQRSLLRRHLVVSVVIIFAVLAATAAIVLADVGGFGVPATLFRKQTFQVTSSSTNAPQPALVARAVSTGTPVGGFGTQITLESELPAGGATGPVAAVRGYPTGGTSGKFGLAVSNAGTLVDVLQCQANTACNFTGSVSIAATELVQQTTAATSVPVTILTVEALSSGTPTAGFGPEILFESKFPDGTTDVSGAIDSPVVSSGHSGGVRLRTSESGTLTTVLDCVPASPCEFSADVIADDAVYFHGRAQDCRSTVASASDLVLGDCNVNAVTGSDTINAITTIGWQEGSIVSLVLVGPGKPTLTNGMTGGANTAPMILQYGLDWTPRGDVAAIEFTLMDVDPFGTFWIELNRSEGMTGAERHNTWSFYQPSGAYVAGAIAEAALGSGTISTMYVTTGAGGSGGTTGLVLNLTCCGTGDHLCTIPCNGSVGPCTYSPPISSCGTCTAKIDPSTDCATLPAFNAAVDLVQPP